MELLATLACSTRPQYQPVEDCKIKIFQKKKVELRAGSPAWPASEAELLEIPSVEEVTVPLPRLPTLHCVTNQQHLIFDF